MGLLDDAIREHLDLKRRRGADPTEIERAEREALGPVRRVPDDEQFSDFDTVREGPPVSGGLSPTYADELLEEEGQGLSDAVGPRESETHRFEDGYQAEEAPPDAPLRNRQSPPRRTAGEAPAPVRAGAPQPGEPPRAPSAGDETIEWDVERALNEESSGQRDDVLEETPEFLQDAPEHDRLWFEQRPPRDFDFNS